VPAAGLAVADDPLDADVIEKLFAKGRDGVWRLRVGETDAHECKTNFGLKYAQAWLRAIAALANNSGGYVFFGVNDKGVRGAGGKDMSHAVVGMGTEEFDRIDPAALAKKVKSVFDPTPRFRTTIASIGGKKVGVIHVEKHESRPVIATKQEGERISEGDIFYRYPGQSSRIKYSDLRAMLDARDAESRAQILPMVERLLQLGPQRTMVADLSAGTLGDGKTAIQIDEALVEKLNFIKEGEFSETEGAPTLRLIGEVQPAGGATLPKPKREVITRADVVDAFLDQAEPDDPRQYIRFAVEVGQGEWLPLHYFASLAGMSRAELVEFINASGGSPHRKAIYTKRVQPNAAFKAAVGRPKAVLDELLARKRIAVETEQEASHAAQAIRALPDGFTKFNRSWMLWLLRRCLVLLEGKSTQSFVRAAICRVDELLFSKDGPG
jgi:hypothetical protein